MSDTAASREAAFAAAAARAEAEQASAQPPPLPEPGLVRKAGRVAKFRARQASGHLPGALQDAATRKRHLRHVTINMGHLTHPALLSPGGDVAAVDWITPAGLPPAPLPGLGFGPLDVGEQAAVRAWLDAGPHDDDRMLERRMDGQGDELGRTMAALAVRLRLAQPSEVETAAASGRVLVDARSLQSAAFGTRGIGRFARAALMALRGQVDDAMIDLLVDRGLEPLPADLAGDCRQVTRVRDADVPAYGFVLQPSPMTASPEPLVPVLRGTAHTVAVVFDYIPLHLPAVYLSHVAARAEYAARLDALRCYDEFVCISDMVRVETAQLLGRDPATMDATVAWPEHVLPSGAQPPSGDRSANGPIVVMTGDDARKNTFGGLAAIGAATSDEAQRDVVVLGMAGQGTRVHHWSIAAAMRPGEAVTLERITDEEMTALLARASLVVVPSFDEGLSLPVIEAAMAGTPVVASDIPAHRELIGEGTFLADPASPASMERAIRRHRGRPETAALQWSRLRAHRHASLEEVVTRSVRQHRPELRTSVPAAAVHVAGSALRVGVATPWFPQRSGVADYSVATLTELARIADVTLYTTSDARVTEGIAQRPVAQAVARTADHDVFLTVLGNSHFHLPHLDLMERIDTVALSHDTRMTEFYMALRGPGGVQQLMLRGTGRRSLEPDLDEQINDMRLLENAAFWEVAHRARMLITHSPCAAPAISAQTGTPVRVLPFANYRSPGVDAITDDMRTAARASLGLRDDAIHLASFGYVDTRTKLTDTVVESAAWLQQWGRPVHLHLVGSASDALADELRARAQEAGLAGFTITGYIPEEAFRDYLLGVDLGIQLRVSPLLGVSGPLSDMAAYGTPALASSGLAIDVDAPAFIERLPDEASPVMVAEAIEHLLAEPTPPAEREAMRRDYLARKSPARYAEELLELLVESAGVDGAGA